MSDYFYDKSKYYYEMYKQNKLVKKVNGVIKDGNKYLTIIRNGKKPMFVGGSVDIGETTQQAIIREIKEECGAEVRNIKYLSKYYYSVDGDFEGITFPNKRVSYSYLCEIETDSLSIRGLDGEFDSNTSLKWCTAEELEELGLWGPDLELVKKIENTEELQNEN